MPVWISELAENDLLEIWNYTRIEWSESQADSYIETFADKFSQLELQPGTGRRIDQIRCGYHRSLHGSHLIFYRQTSDGIEVIRVLHERMNPTLHL